MPRRRANPPIPALAQRPTLRLDGQPTPVLDAALLAIDVVRRARHRPTCNARFAALGQENGAPVLRFLDRALLDIGRDVDIALGGATIFAGRIRALAAVFPGDSPPAARIEAEATRLPPRGAVPHARVLRLGAGLRSFTASLAAGTRARPAAPTAEASADGLVDAQPGDRMEFEGVGAAFSGAYTLTAVTIRFDLEAGLRTLLAGTKARTRA